MLRLGATALLFFALALPVYAPSLHGPFVSDDYFYVSGNPYVQQLSWANVGVILDPTGDAARGVQNYAPVYLLAQSLAWQAFGPDTTGHHVLQLAVHAAASALFVALLAAWGVAWAAAFAGGALFLLHPANVEAVAWISQLRTTLSLALALAALLAAERRRTALGAALFAAALLAKATALFALPVLAVRAWVRAPAGERAALRRAGVELGVWCAAAGLYALAQLPANLHTNAGAPPIDPDPLVRARSLVAIAGRYLAMAATGTGLAAFHEPAPVRSSLDPLFLGSLAALAALGVRTVTALRRRAPEAAGWVWAAAAFAPVSQIVPFLYPMADRYLYTILPGLLAGVLLALWPVRGDLGAAAIAVRGRRPLAAAAAAAVLGLGTLFAFQGHARARVWATASGPVDDAIAHYPDGTSARLRRAQLLAQRGEPDAAVATLRSVKPFALEMNALLADPALRGLRGHAGFDALLREVAGRWIEWGRGQGHASPGELRQIAIAHLVRGELPEARAALERALAEGGPREPELRADLEQVARLEAALRANAAREAARSTPPPPGGTPSAGGP